MGLFVLYPSWQRRVTVLLVGYTVITFLSILVAFGDSSLWFGAIVTGLLSFAGIACSLTVLTRGTAPTEGMKPRTEPLPGDRVYKVEVAFGPHQRQVKVVGRDQLIPLLAVAPGVVLVGYVTIAVLLSSAFFLPP